MRVLLAGASGMIGSALRVHLERSGHQVRVMTRLAGGDYRWDGSTAESVPGQALAWADGLVSLNGANLARQPWTRPYRRLILDSRVAPTRALAEALAACPDPPRAWVSASATGFYGEGAGEAALDEASPGGTTFLAEVVRRWEQATTPVRASGSPTRVVLARTGLVLAPDGGALAPLARLARYGLATRIGSGRQWWPWIALDDEVRALAFALECPALSGPANLVGPAPARAVEVTRTVARALHRPHLLWAPAWLVRTGLGGAAELLLSSQRVHPAALLGAGFTFQHPTVGQAVAAALGR